MPKYEVVRGWHGVKVGGVLVLDKVHPSLESHLRLMRGEAGVELTPATPESVSDAPSRKEVITTRLKELGIEFKGNLGAEKLSELLPPGELENLFPAE